MLFNKLFRRHINGGAFLWTYRVLVYGSLYVLMISWSDVYEWRVAVMELYGISKVSIQYHYTAVTLAEG